MNDNLLEVYLAVKYLIIIDLLPLIDIIMKY
jgi:hypothetical protein